MSANPSNPLSNPYVSLVSGYAALLNSKPAFQGDERTPHTMPTPPNAPKALLFSPHPDDECIVGGLALRLQRESHWHIINVAVTQGSRRERQTERWQELEAACAYLGFDLLATVPNGLENINLDYRNQHPTTWSAAVDVIANILQAQQPQLIFIPHADDWNRTHIGVHYLVMDALTALSADFRCFVIETEFWGAMRKPNLLVEIGINELADLTAALAQHRGEVARNPYHLRLPAWMIDNVRRGAEVVSGQGATAPDFTFGALYRLSYWQTGGLHNALPQGRNLACSETADVLYADACI